MLVVLRNAVAKKPLLVRDRFLAAYFVQPKLMLSASSWVGKDVRIFVHQCLLAADVVRLMLFLVAGQC